MKSNNPSNVIMNKFYEIVAKHLKEENIKKTSNLDYRGLQDIINKYYK